jgi:hypothetical protein
MLLLGLGETVPKCEKSFRNFRAIYFDKPSF